MWDGLRFMDHPDYLFDERFLHQRGDAETNLRHFMHERHRETLSESWQHVCRRSVCSCAERRTHATRWSCARWSDLSSDRRTRCFLQTVAVGGGGGGIFWWWWVWWWWHLEGGGGRVYQ